MTTNNNKSLYIDGCKISKIFKDLKNKDINTYVEIKDDKLIDKNLLNSEDIIDKIHYYRNLKKISKLEMAQSVSIDEETYAKYENKKTCLINNEYINKFWDMLNVDEKLVLPEFNRFIEEYPLTKIAEIFKSYNISVNKLKNLTKLSTTALTGILRTNGNIKITSNTYKKLFEYWKTYENY